MLTIAEMLVAFLWMSDLTPRLALSLTAVQLSLFSAAMFVAIRRHRPVPCGCGGLLGSDLAGWSGIWRNVVLAVIALLASTLPGAPPVSGLIADLAAPSRLASRLLAAIAATTVLLVSVFGVQALVALRSSAAKTPAAPIAIKKTAMEVIGGHVGD